MLVGLIAIWYDRQHLDINNNIRESLMNNFEKVSDVLRKQGVFCEGCPFVRAALNAAYDLDISDPSISHYSRHERLDHFKEWVEYNDNVEISDNAQRLAGKLRELALRQVCQGYTEGTSRYNFEQDTLQLPPENSPSHIHCELEVRYESEIVSPRIAKFIEDYYSD